MGRRCCIAGCASTSRLPEHHGVTYHSFPLDPTIRNIWIRNACLSSERQITKSVLVCSRHFRRADFQPQRSGKYLLKQRVFPTVFPWGKIDPEQLEADLLSIKSTNVTGNLQTPENVDTENATMATVEATVAQIMAEAAELNAKSAQQENDGTCENASGLLAHIKYEPVTAFIPGARLEAQDFDGGWHAARVVEVDTDDREVLIKFERSGKIKTAIAGTEEWIPMNSIRLRQKVSTKPVPIFELAEKCMARWSGPRKFPGTVQKLLGNDLYEVLFDDGYVKNVRAIHMTKIVVNPPDNASPAPTTESPLQSPTIALTPPNVSPALKREIIATNVSPASVKKRAPPGPRKDWPLLDLSKLDLPALNLPEIPRDGEWTCHWVNDQPIGREGFLVVGEHRKPTVIVEDWRLPTGWIKHMYQRSNVLGKWDVILVSPTGKRFRSKSDLKLYLEDKGQTYNPDIYDFSIHRRRAKDLNAYVFTPDYIPQQPIKQKHLETNLPSKTDATETLSAKLTTSSKTKFLETPIAPPVPPMELMTTKEEPITSTEIKKDKNEVEILSVVTIDIKNEDSGATLKVEDGYVYIGGLKVQIVDNLFRCPQQGCSKNFRKENHLQIHVKHYHHDLAKLLGACPKMMELAEKHTHKISPESHEPQPKNQISNQEFFAKMHQQDLQHSRSHRKTINATTVGSTPTEATTSAATPPLENFLSPIYSDGDINTVKQAIGVPTMNIKTEIKEEIKSEDGQTTLTNVADTPILSTPLTLPNQTLTANTSPNKSHKLFTSTPATTSRRSRFVSSRRGGTGARKSNRQRTTRRYLTAAASAVGKATLPPLMVTGDSNFGAADFEETRHSFNATPDGKILIDTKPAKSKILHAPATPLSSIDSPMTADSGSSSFQPIPDNESVTTTKSQQYIKENGQLIKIVCMRQEEIINCLCNYGEEDGLMIQCELCLCWQHGVCNGIVQESDVPEKYVCYTCRNPARARESMRFKHDQDWLYEGKLPVANYHTPNPNLLKRFDLLKKSHTLTGNLIELRRFMHALDVKINIAKNLAHPKMYLWAKKWDDDKADIKKEECSPSKRIKLETVETKPPMPNIPQPEAPIEPVECQQRLLEHILIQQNSVMNRLADIEAEMDELDKVDDMQDLKNEDINVTKDVLATFIKELDTLKLFAQINAQEATKEI